MQYTMPVPSRPRAATMLIVLCGMLAACEQESVTQEPRAAGAASVKERIAGAQKTKKSKTPTLSLSASQATVFAGDTVTLTWNSTNSTSCSAAGGWSGARSLAGSATVQDLRATTSFSLSCNGKKGSASQSVTVEVLSPSSPPDQKFVANIGAAPLRAPLSSSLDPGSAYTLEGWIHVDRPIPHAWIMGKGRPIDGGAGGVQLSAALKLDGDGRKLQVATSAFFLDAPEALPVGRWTHVAAVLDGTQARLLINGKIVATRSFNEALATLADVPFGVGAPYDARGTAAGGHEPGLHARQLRVWGRARSTAQIVAAMGESVPSDRDGLVATWPLNERNGDTAADALGSLALTRSLEVGTSRTAVLDDGPYFESSTITLPAGVLTDGSSTALIDIDSDGDQDLVVFQVAVPPTFPATERRLLAFRNDAGRFVEATADVLGELRAINPRAAWVADFTGDGRPDLFVADTGTDTHPYPGTQSRLLVGSDARRLVDETAARLPVVDHYSHGIAVADVDGNGSLDVYLANYDGPTLYLNDGTGRFRDATDRVVEARVWPSPPSAAAFCDINLDGRPDLIVGGSFNASVGAGTESPNRLLMNDGTGRFAPDARFVLPGKLHGDQGNTNAVTCADMNGDAAPDLVIATDFYGRVPGLQLLLNDGKGQLVDASASLNVVFPRTDGWVHSIDVVDVNNDKLPDLVLRTISSSYSPLNLARSVLLNRGSGRLVDASEIFVANTNFGLAVGDFDRDGRTDLLTVDLKDRLHLYRSSKPINAALFDD